MTPKIGVRVFGNLLVKKAENGVFHYKCTFSSLNNALAGKEPESQRNLNQKSLRSPWGMWVLPSKGKLSHVHRVPIGTEIN